MQNPKQVSPVSALGLSDTETESSDLDENNEVNKALRYRKPLAFEQSDNDSRDVSSVGFFRSRFAALERIKDTPSRESTPAPSPIPSRLTRSRQLADDSSRASTPNSENSKASTSVPRRGRGRSRRGRRKGGKPACRKVNLDEDESSNQFAEANGSVASNDLSMDMNENSLMEVDEAKADTDSKDNGALTQLANNVDTKNKDADDTMDSFDVPADETSNSSCTTEKSKVFQSKTPEPMDDNCSDTNDNAMPEDNAASTQESLSEGKSQESDGRVEAASSQENEDETNEIESSATSSRKNCDTSVLDQHANSDGEDAAELNDDNSNMPFESYSQESVATETDASLQCNSSQASEPTGEDTKKMVDAEPCKPSTSGLNLDLNPAREDSNDSASTSAYSGSDLSNEDEDTKCSLNSLIKSEPEPAPSNACDDKGTEDTVKVEVKQEGDGEQIKIEVKTNDEEEATKRAADKDSNSEGKPEEKATDTEIKEEDIKKEPKEEEKAEESEDEDPEITVSVRCEELPPRAKNTFV